MPRGRPRCLPAWLARFPLRKLISPVNFFVSCAKGLEYLLADELLAMADRIGVDRKWIQKAGRHDEHFDIAMTKRALAVAAGAIEVSMMDLGRILRERREAYNAR